MRPAEKLFDVGGTPLQNAALAVIMVATMATDLAGPEDRMVDQACAESLVTNLLLAAAVGGFRCSGEFRALVDAGTMNERLQNLALDVVFFGGGPGAVFSKLAMVVMPAGAMGAKQ